MSDLDMALYLQLLTDLGYEVDQIVDEALEIHQDDLSDLDERAFIAGYVVAAFMFTPRDDDHGDELSPVSTTPLTGAAA